MGGATFSELLEEMAFLAELKGENPFKLRAWLKAAELLEEQDVGQQFRSGKLAATAGIGKGILALVSEYLETGQLAELRSLKKEFPEGILELWGLRGLGPKKVKSLYENLGIGSLAELEYACEENRLLTLKGFGEKTQTSILKEIRNRKAQAGKVLLPRAQFSAEQELELLRTAFPDTEFALTGDLRRQLEIVDRIEILVRKKLDFASLGYRQVEKGIWEKQGDLLPTSIRESAPERWGFDLWITTGGNWALEGLDPSFPNHPTEESVAVSLKRPCLPPEARDLGLWPKSEGEKLHTGIQDSHILGAFHFHTTASDGKDSLRDMAKKAIELGWQYIGLSDHSGSSFYANGLKIDRLLEQKKEIEAVQKEFPSLRIFHGVESDILSDGSLDYPDSVLEQLDFVIASIHSQMNMSKEKMTARLVRALSNPYTTWLGHPTGRLLLGRAGYEFDWKEILHVAREEGKSMELNANPYRLDLDWRILPLVSEYAVPVALSPDAHSKEGFSDMRYGVAMARKGGLRPEQVLNTLPLKEMERWLMG